MRLAVFVWSVLLVLAPDAQAAGIFVDKNSAIPDEDGSTRAPFRTITAALDRARELRFGSGPDRLPRNEVIVVAIAASPTPYIGSFDPAVFDPSSPSYDPGKERLPLLLNIPRLVLRGGTVISDDENGLPAFVTSGTETTIRSDRPQAPRQHLVMLTRTFPLAASGFPQSIEMAGNDVTIVGLSLLAEAGRQLPSALIGIDGVSNFVVRGNLFVQGGNGIWTRLSSGRITSNLMVNNTVGLYLTGGSFRFPAALDVVENRIIGGAAAVTGLTLVGGAETTNLRAGLDFGANQFARVPIPAFNRASSPDEVPDAIAATVVGNAVSGTPIGIRATGYLQHAYSLPAGQDETAFVTAVYRRNSSMSNSVYGLVVDAGQIALGDRRIVNFNLSFNETTLEESATGPAIFSLWRFAGSISPSSPNPFAEPNPTFAHDSTITACGDVTLFHYDNRSDPDPATNPAPTNNRLSVNDVELTERSVAEVISVPAAPPNCVRN